MDDTREATGYWCHMCNQMVEPIVEFESVNCPFCLGGFVEEMETAPVTAASQTLSHHDRRYSNEFEGETFDSDRSLSLWAPILLGMMSNPRRRHRVRRLEFSRDNDEEDQVEQNEDNNHHYRHHHHHHEGESELDRELESIIRRRRRSSATILQLLQGIRTGLQSSESASESDTNDRNENSNNRDRERVILINPFNQTIIVQSSSGLGNNSEYQNQNANGSLGDYFMGPGLDLLLQHLAENDPNRYGTPPADNEAVEALPTVTIEDNLQCSVCLEDLEIGAEAKEMPCKHRFHSGCILPWLELHSSCPVCRYQLPTEESKLNSEGLRSNNISSHITGDAINGNNSTSRGEEGDVDGRNGNGRRFSVLIP